MQTAVDQYLSIGEASEYLGISIDTLRRWARKGKILSYRSPGRHRYFKKSDLDQVFGTRYEREETPTSKTPKAEEKNAQILQPVKPDVTRAEEEISEPVVSVKPIETPSDNPQTMAVPDGQPFHNIHEIDFIEPLESKPPQISEPSQNTIQERQPLHVPRYIKHQNVSKYDLLLKPHISGEIAEKAAQEVKPVTIDNLNFHSVLIPSAHRPPKSFETKPVNTEGALRPNNPSIEDVIEKTESNAQSTKTQWTRRETNPKLEKFLKNAFLIFLAVDLVLFFFFVTGNRLNSPIN